MKNLINGLVSLPLLFILCCQQQADKPPVAKIENVVDEYWGVKVDDPYRYFENKEDTYVLQWYEDQADYASSILNQLSTKESLLKRLKELDSGKPFTTRRIYRMADGSLFYLKRMADENISKLYFVDADGNENLLVDPGAIKSEDGQHFSIDTYSPSPDGNYVVYGLAKGGSERTILHILEVGTGDHLPEKIEDIETAYNRPYWLADGSGFMYARRQDLPKDAPETEIYKKSKAYFHKLNTDQNEDILIFGYEHSKRAPISDVDFPSVYIPQNSNYAIVKIKHGDANDLTIYTAPIKSLFKDDIPWKKVCDVEDEVTDFTVHGGDIYLMSAKNAPRFKVVKSVLKTPGFTKAKTVIPAGEQVIESIYTAKDALYAGVLYGGINKILRLEYSVKSQPKFLELPGNAAGYISSINADMDGFFVYTTAWTKGSLIYRYDPAKDIFTDTKLLPKGKYDELPGFTSIEVMVKSHDGVMVPLSIMHKEDLKLDGSNPTLVIGYGAYGFAENVFFSASRLAWLEQGGVYAIAHVRGGGDFGKEWHMAGQKTTKPNTWKDFIACAEYLIEHGYTSKERIAGQGGSAGGILIGRAITERPDLFAAAIINVGDLDAVRAETTTNGVPNIPEFGTVTIEEEFHALLEMSSYHQVKDGVKYPAVLLTHGFNDPRVEPWNSAKMTARLQAATASDRPVLLRIDFGAGHGIGSTRDQYLEKKADEWAFLLWQFGIN